MVPCSPKLSRATQTTCSGSPADRLGVLLPGMGWIKGPWAWYCPWNLHSPSQQGRGKGMLLFITESQPSRLYPRLNSAKEYVNPSVLWEKKNCYWVCFLFFVFFPRVLIISSTVQSFCSGQAGLLSTSSISTLIPINGFYTFLSESMQGVWAAFRRQKR